MPSCGTRGQGDRWRAMASSLRLWILTAESPSAILPFKWFLTDDNSLEGGDFVEELISIPVTAERLGVSETVVYKLVKRGDLSPAKVEQVGKQTRRYFRAGDVEALRQQRGGEAKV
jgi:hypothetical protein